MCGRVVMACDSNTLISLNNNKPIRNGIRYKQSYNVCPTNYLPVYHNNEIEMMKWGMKKDNIYIINARSETADIYFKGYRKCLILIQGYYEWKNDNVYYFYNEENKIIYLAGLYKKEIDEVTLNNKVRF
jgi:putative SOS response-associated peptidase YedK